MPRTDVVRLPLHDPNNLLFCTPSFRHCVLPQLSQFSYLFKALSGITGHYLSLPFLTLEQARGLWHSFCLFLVVSLPWLYWLNITLRLLRMQTNISAEMSLDVVCITLMFFSEGFHSALIDIYKCNQAVTPRENMKRRN